MHNDGTVMRALAWREVLPHHGATSDAAARGSTTADADTGAAAVTAALRARVQGGGHPLLVAKG